MIRIRYADPIVAESLHFNSFIYIDKNGEFISTENEKNTPYYHKLVNDKLRFIIGSEKRQFRIISIQTITSCNMTCCFCPINKNVYKLGKHYMSNNLLHKIAKELCDIDYSDQILLFTNNEPLLDRRIIEIVKLFRLSCPNADIKILTNGILITDKLIKQLFSNGLSSLIINNYSDGKRLIKSVENIISHAQEYKEYNIMISIRNKNEILTTRAGQSPNKQEIEPTKFQYCALPFIDINVSYDGTITQCCFDALSKSNMGNVQEDNLQSIWENNNFQELRNDLFLGSRNKNTLCSNCDFDGFRKPYHHDVVFKRKDLENIP